MPIAPFERTQDDVVIGRRLWGLFMVCGDPWTAESVMRGDAVLIANLTAEPLRRALRGRRIPQGQEYLRVTNEMLDAVAEAGPIQPKPKRRGTR